MRTLIILIITLLFFNSCEKKNKVGKTIIQGAVKDYYTNAPIVGIKLSVNYKNSVFSMYTDVLVSSTTDSLGNYYIQFEWNEDISISRFVHTVRTKHGSYSCLDLGIYSCEFEYIKGAENTIDLDLFPISKLKLIFINKIPKNSNDSIHYTIKNNLIFKGLPISNTIVGIDSITFGYNIYGNDSTTICWETTVNNQLVKDSTEILIKDVGKMEYKMYY